MANVYREKFPQAYLEISMVLAIISFLDNQTHSDHNGEDGLVSA